MTATGETMAPAIETSIIDRPDLGGSHRAVRGSRVPGLVAASLGTLSLLVWFVWRAADLALHPVPLLFFVAEASGLVLAVVVAVGLSRAGTRRHVFERELPDSHWYAIAIADIVGRTRAEDLRLERGSLRASPMLRPRNLADATITAVLLEGPRRLTLVITLAFGLLVGVSPMGVPPWWAAIAALAGYGCLAIAHVSLGRGRLWIGDRLRWSYGAIGEVVAHTDVVGHAPRRWLGSMAVAVGLSVSVALRGFSDRWTHGLTAMTYSERFAALVLALSLVLGALFTIHTTPQPDPADPDVVVRRLEESTVRQSLLAVAVLLGLAGLLAGVLPGSEPDTGDEPPAAVIEIDGARHG